MSYPNIFKISKNNGKKRLPFGEKDWREISIVIMCCHHLQQGVTVYATFFVLGLKVQQVYFQ